MPTFSAFIARTILPCIVTLFGLTAGQFAHSAEKNSTLRLLVVPQFPATEIHATWSKLLDGLKKDGLPEIELVFAKDITEFESQFKAGQAELIYCNPYHMVMAKKAQGYTPLIRDSKPLTGILVAETGSSTDEVQSLNDLNGKTLLFPSPNAFGASLYMRALLERTHGIRFTPFYAKTHSNAYRHVVKGEALAAGGVGSTLATIAAKMFGTPAITCTLPMVKPGAMLTGLSISAAPSGMRAMRRRASLNSSPERS